MERLFVRTIGKFDNSESFFYSLKKKEKKLIREIFTSLFCRELQNNSQGCENPVKATMDFNEEEQQYNKNVVEQKTNKHNNEIRTRISHPRL